MKAFRVAWNATSPADKARVKAILAIIIAGTLAFIVIPILVHFAPASEQTCAINVFVSCHHYDGVTIAGATCLVVAAAAILICIFYAIKDLRLRHRDRR